MAYLPHEAQALNAADQAVRAGREMADRLHSCGWHRATNPQTWDSPAGCQARNAIAQLRSQLSATEDGVLTAVAGAMRHRDAVEAEVRRREALADQAAQAATAGMVAGGHHG